MDALSTIRMTMASSVEQHARCRATRLNHGTCSAAERPSLACTAAHTLLSDGTRSVEQHARCRATRLNHGTCSAAERPSLACTAAHTLLSDGTHPSTSHQELLSQATIAAATSTGELFLRLLSISSTAHDLNTPQRSDGYFFLFSSSEYNLYSSAPPFWATLHRPVSHWAPLTLQSSVDQPLSVSHHRPKSALHQARRVTPFLSVHRAPDRCGHRHASHQGQFMR